MPPRILESDVFAETLYYTEDDGAELPEDKDHSFYTGLKRRPALAMLAAKIHDLATTHYPIMVENMAVLIVNRKNLKGFQILFHEDASEEECSAAGEFLEELNQAADNDKNIIRNTEDRIFFGAENETILLDFLISFAVANDYDFNRWDIEQGYEGDFAAFHAQWPHKDHDRWQDDAKDALSLSWVIAALPEKIYPTQELLLKEAYRTRYLGIYPEAQIRNAIEDQKPARRCTDGWSCKFH